jgi:predicted metalloprotease with PDZ domain
MPKISAPIHFQVETPNLHNHLFHVTLTIAAPQAQQEVRLPVWIPGSYLVREFSKNLQDLQAQQGTKKPHITQLGKAHWQVDCAADKPLTLRYAVYAFDNSVRTAWLDANRGFFNGTSLCLKVSGLEAADHHLQVVGSDATKGWQLATGLTPLRTEKAGFGTYTADGYDTLVDCPVEMGAFWSGSFVAGGIPHRFVVAGAPASFDGQQLLDDTRAICETEIAFWHSNKKQIPYKSYLFMLNAVADGYGGLEHRNSTALICNRKDLPRLRSDTLAPATHKQPEGYTTLLGLISHEYFHTWNVKRLRPTELASYDYTQENYTELLWFFEGFTSYYDDLLLRRAKRIDDATYLKLLGKTINLVQQTPGRLVQSVAQASFDAWVKYYRQDENTPNATVSYYTKGSLVALCLDLTLRAEGKTTLDTVMQTLWQRCQGGPMSERDVREVLQALGGRSFNKEMDQWVHGTKDLPVLALLEKHGVKVEQEPAPIAQQLGLRVKEANGITITNVLRGGPAEKAGFASGDEWLAVEMCTGRDKGVWRLQTLDDLPLYSGKSKTVQAWVARDKRVSSLALALPKPSQAVRLGIADATKVKQWLEGSAICNAPSL